MPAQPRIGATIRRARQRLRMSQDELALKVGASRSAVNAWERDRARPRNIVALEEVLGVSLEAGSEPERAAPGPLADLEPWHDEWEEQVAADPDLPLYRKRELITDSRAAREAYAARKREQASRPPGRAGG